MQHAPTLANPTHGAIAAANFHCVAEARESDRALDLAVLVSTARLCVVRCVDQVAHSDHTALATMISEGDFVWGAVVYNQGEAPSSPGLVESFHVSQLDQLVARLNELREACGEAG